MTDCFIYDAVRTPRGKGRKKDGALADAPPLRMAQTVLQALPQRGGFDSAEIEDVIHHGVESTVHCGIERPIDSRSDVMRFVDESLVQLFVREQFDEKIALFHLLPFLYKGNNRCPSLKLIFYNYLLFGLYGT